MHTVWKRLIGAVMAAALSPAIALASPQDHAPAGGRDLTVETLTALAAFGRGALSPDGRWAVYEKRGPYDAIPRFEYEWRSTWAAMELWAVDLTRPAAGPVRLLPDEGPGLQRLAWSPSGDRLLVTRFRDGRLEPGVVRMADRSVRWSGLTLDVPRTGAQASWRSDDEVLLLVRPGHDLPAALAYQGATPDRMAQAWARTAQGREPSRTIVDAAGGVASTPTPRSDTAMVVWSVGTGAVRTLAQGGVSDFALAPDRRRMAILAGDEAAPLRAEEVVQFESPFRQRLRIIDLDTGEAWEPLEALEVAGGLLRWSPDSRNVLVWGRPDDAAWRDGGLLRVGIGGGVALNLEGLDPGSSTEVTRGVRADWIGQTPVMFARASDGGRAEWRALSPDGAPRALTSALSVVPSNLASSGPGSVFLFADGGYWSMDLTGVARLTPEGVAVTPVTAGDQELASRLKVNEAPRRSWASARGERGETLVVDAAGARTVGTGTGPAGRVLAVSDRGELFLRRTGLSEALVLRTQDGETVIDDVNAGFADVAFRPGEALVHRDIDGRETRSWLFLPRDGAPIRGVVIKVYPDWADEGEWPGALALTYGLNPQILTAAGYAVLAPATPQTGPVARRGDDLVRSLDLAVDAALAAHPELPADRMAVFGHSFGGYAVLEIASRTRRYKAYIASSAFSDMAGVWGELEPGTRILPEDGGMMRAAQGWAETGQAGLPGPPWAAPEAYLASSPYLRADRIRDPLLLLAADMDFVPLSQSERMYSAILRTGGRARLVTYWGEHHNLWSPANIEDRFRQMFDWLALWLESGATAPPDPAGAPSA
ncbi:MAG: prolyl oligopeptidase family serine peptidase [Brevundimonas sp.]|nr:prolyl oligopeptidase family serine peptidase [Brevundimonas sp.]